MALLHDCPYCRQHVCRTANLATFRPAGAAELPIAMAWTAAGERWFFAQPHSSSPSMRWAKAKKDTVAKKVEKLQEAKVTTLRRVQLARSCAIKGEDVVGEVKGIDSRKCTNKHHKCEQGAWAGAQSLQHVVSSISCARRP